MPPRITLILSVASSAALVVLLSTTAPIAAATKTSFCADLSKYGGATALTQNASSPSGSSASVAELKRLAKEAPSKNLKVTLNALATLYTRGTTSGSKLTAATTKLGTLTSSTCASAASPSASASGLSGTWSGTYSGASDGTFTLNWTASGSNLTGTIVISDLGDDPIPINGTLNGNTISFGTVGTAAVTYKGTVSGNSMSGTWQAPIGNGNWNATKQS